MSPEERKKLLDYIQTAISVETDIETQNQIKAAAIKEKENIKPVLWQKELPEIPDVPVLDSSMDFPSVIMGGFAAVCFTLGIIYIFISTIGGLIFIIMGLTFLIPLLALKRQANKEAEHYYKERQSVEAVYDRIKKENDNLKAEWNKKLIEWNDSNDALLAKMEQPYNETLHIRDQLYAIDAIYPKYQNLPALTSIYEYFITGRCDELTGPHGAYNMYEDEVRKDMVISQLNTVIENLEQIKQSQFMLYEQVKMIQKTASAINAELAQIKGYTIAMTQLTALNTYYTALNERNSRTTMYYHLLS